MTVKSILEEAEKNRIQDWRYYDYLRRKLSSLPVTKAEYEKAVSELCRILGF